MISTRPVSFFGTANGRAIRPLRLTTERNADANMSGDDGQRVAFVLMRGRSAVEGGGWEGGGFAAVSMRLLVYAANRHAQG